MERPTVAPRRESRGWQGSNTKLGTVWWEWVSGGKIQTPPQFDEVNNIGDLFHNTITGSGGDGADQMWLFRKPGTAKIAVWDDITKQWDDIKAMKDFDGCIRHPLDKDRILTARDQKSNKPSWVKSASHKQKMKHYQ